MNTANSTSSGGRPANVRVLVECAMMIALATVLSLLKIWEAPLGGSVTYFSMVPIILVSFLLGTRAGLASAFVYSVIQLFLGLSNVAYVPDALGITLCVIFDYIVPFTLIGLAGFIGRVLPRKTPTFARVIAGTVAVCVLRFLCHWFIGGVVWYSITKAGAWNEIVFKYSMWTYSFVYNITFFGPESAITVIGATIITPLLARLGNRLKPGKNG